MKRLNRNSISADHGVDFASHAHWTGANVPWSIQGIVTDESRRGINATVTALTSTPGSKWSSDQRHGLFLFDNVEPGTYSISVENVGFKQVPAGERAVQAAATYGMPSEAGFGANDGHRQRGAAGG